MSNYLRNRPFLVVEYIARPVAGSKTHIKDFAKSAEWDVTEKPSIVRNVSNRIITDAHVIIDLLRHKVIKNRFNKDPDEVVYAHFYTKYQAEIDQVVLGYQPPVIIETADPVSEQDDIEDIENQPPVIIETADPVSENNTEIVDDQSSSENQE
jgi:hypothetical protein